MSTANLLKYSPMCHIFLRSQNGLTSHPWSTVHNKMFGVNTTMLAKSLNLRTM